MTIAKVTTESAPSATSPTTFAKPIMCTETGAWIATVTFSCSISRADFLLELLRDRDVIDRRAGLRIGVEQLRGDHRARKVVRDQPADDAGLQDVLADPRKPGGVRLEIRGDHVPRLDAALDDFRVSRVRRPERLHARAIDAVDEEDFVRRDLERLEELRREHVAVAGNHRNQQPVCAAELRLVVEIGPDVLVLERKLLVEIRVELEAGRRDPAERHGHEREDRENQLAVTEYVRLEPGCNSCVAGFLHGAGPPGIGSRRTPPSPATISAPSPEGWTAEIALRSSCCVRTKLRPPSWLTSMTPAMPATTTVLSSMRAAGVEERARAGRDCDPAFAAVLGAEQVAAQAEGEQRIAVERQDSMEGSVVRRRQLAPGLAVVVGTEQASRFRTQVQSLPAGPRASAFR